MHYSIYVNTKDGQVALTKQAGSVEVLPNWDDGFEGCWSGREWQIERNPAGFLGKLVNGKWKIYAKDRATTKAGTRPTRKPKSIWDSKEYFSDKGRTALNDMFPTSIDELDLGARLRPKPLWTGVAWAEPALARTAANSARAMTIFMRIGLPEGWLGDRQA